MSIFALTFVTPLGALHTPPAHHCEPPPSRRAVVSGGVLAALPLPALPVKLPVSLIYVRPLQWLAPRVTMGASSISQIVTNRESPDRLQFSTEHEVRDEVSLSMA